MMTDAERRAWKIFKFGCAASIVAMWCALFMGCGTLADAAGKIKWPEPTITWTADNSTPASTDVPVTVTPKVEEKPAVSADAEEAAHGFTDSKPISCTLKQTRITGGTWDYTLTGCNWKVIDGCWGRVHLYALRNGKWTGGSFDHARPNNAQRDFKNVYGHYSGLRGLVPIKGETVAFVIYEYGPADGGPGKWRSNAIFTKWVGE